ncbi:ABC transporter substrate-binding protein [Glycomyces xiaoerkulensis]|uniref:ABC transporter substrate-binding protein n=1 Tax=Glycomyces xiaoerkulensis TaxID=2038139 RepID=UPI000C262BA7|nr:iron-siderophore ABC transporter substrate-binding protein [Glycomyces xiaoerkulensis]
MRIHPRALIALPAAAAVLAAAACGTTEDGPDEGEETTAEAGPVSVVDATDTTVELDAPATDVVALEWAEAEMAASLGVMPVGVADVEGYHTWVGASVPLDDSVEDVGTRAEPSVDSIAALSPDLVITENRDEGVIEQLREFAPVAVAAGSSEEDNLQRMEDDLFMIAALLGKTEEAGALMDDFQSKVDEVADAIAEAGTADVPYLWVDGWEDGGTVAIRMFGPSSQVGNLATEVGLTNAWDGETDGQWGLGQNDLEGMSEYADTDLRLIYNESDNSGLFAETLPGNDLWAGLGFVEDGHTYQLTEGAWTFGGPESSKVLLDFFAEVYTS